MQLKPNSTLQEGKYEIISVLGQGGFGITYLAEQTLMDRKVCIKEFFIKEYCERDEATSRVSLGTASNAAMMERYMAKFIKEAKTIAKLDNPNIVRIYDVFKENGTAYIVMEYIDGKSLGEYVKENGPLSEEKAISYIRRVCDALSYAHGQHIMHLDVKPSNIMLDQEHDRAVLIDFGLAKQYTEGGEQTSSTPVGISQGYAPLEQYQTGGVKEFSPATDVYSLGATLYKLLTGNTPPSASEVNEDGLPPMPDNISLAVRQAVDKAMQPRRKDRPQSVAAFLLLMDSPASENTTTEDEPEEEVTVIGKPAPPIEKEAILSQPQKLASIETPSKIVAPSVVSKPIDAPQSTTRRLWTRYGVIGGIVAMLVLCLVLFLPRSKKSDPDIPDSMTINGAQACSVDVGSKAIVKEFDVEKNFEERWSYSGVPEWCTAKAAEGKITINVSENKSKEDRTATIVFQKKDGKSILAKLSINQKADETAKEKVTAVKEVGSVRFASTPSGASIWIDGKDTKKTTPATIDGITAGKHSVYLILDGYVTHEGMITVTSKKRGVLNRTLTLKAQESMPSSEQQQTHVDTKKSNPNNIEEKKEEADEEAIPFQIVEVKPSFRGGDANAFSSWVNSQLVYPDIAKENGVQGRVTLQFTVKSDGRVADVTVLRGVDPSLDQEALRVVRNSPKWQPGRQRDKAVSVRYTFPVIFQLR